MDDQSWAIRQLVIKTGHRFSGKEVQIPTSRIDDAKQTNQQTQKERITII
jgi:hypothetical protein